MTLATGSRSDAASFSAAVPMKLRSDWRPWPFELESVDLVFELDAVCTRVTSTLRLKRRQGLQPHQPLDLAGRRLRLLEAELDGRPVDGRLLRFDEAGLTIDRVPERFELRLRVELNPSENLSGRGLFMLDGVLVTQMEPEGMSRVCFFPDRPDVLTRYRVTLIADPTLYPVLLSNGNRASERILRDGRLEVVYDDPFRKPSYVFGLVAGQLASLHDTCRFPSGRTVRLAVYAPARHVEHCRFALEAVTRSMLWDERTYGLECDVEDFQVVALNGFPGAMENKGLNIYDLAGVLADPTITTDDEALTIERIIAHEYFHNWTGNRVTCRDWFQLSLKEGLTRFRDQSYIDDLLGPGVYRLDIVRNLLRNQFPEDDGPNRHPVRPDQYADVEELYTATVYEKGAELIRMLRTLLGQAHFAAGVRRYLRTFDGQAVTVEDFVHALTQAQDFDIEGFHRWYTVAGRPRLTVRRERLAGGSVRLLLSQHLPEANTAHLPMVIPVRVSWVDPVGTAPVPNPRRSDGGEPSLIVLKTMQATVDYENLPPGAVPALLEGFSAPVSLNDDLNPAEQRILLRGARDPWARWNAVQRLTVLAIREQAAAVHQGRAPAFDAELLDTLGAALDGKARSPANTMLCAELLRMPDEPVLSEGMPIIDVDGHHVARNALRAALGHHLRSPLLAAVDASGVAEDRALMNVNGMARRRLAAVALDLLAATGDDSVARWCHDRSLSAPTMTERFDALSCLLDMDHPLRQPALDAFVEQWRAHPTVVNKWFMAQALSRAPGALDRIMALQQHPLFNSTDIAQGMALFGSFFRQNRVVFHDASGRAYEWLADLLILIDSLKRPGAVWLTPQLSAWRRHTPKRQVQIRKALERVVSATDGASGTHALARRLLEN